MIIEPTGIMHGRLKKNPTFQAKICPWHFSRHLSNENVAIFVGPKRQCKLALMQLLRILKQLENDLDCKIFWFFFLLANDLCRSADIYVKQISFNFSLRIPGVASTSASVSIRWSFNWDRNLDDGPRGCKNGEIVTQKK